MSRVTFRDGEVLETGRSRVRGFLRGPLTLDRAISRQEEHVQARRRIVEALFPRRPVPPEGRRP